MWPFNKKIKIVIEDTEAAKKRKAEEDKRYAEKVAAEKERQDKNRKLMWQTLDKLIKDEITLYKAEHPQPFQAGDIVGVDYYSYTYGLAGWFSTTRQFVETFKEMYEGVTPSIKLKVAKVWVDTGWITDRFDRFSEAYSEITAASNDTVVINRTTELFNRFKKAQKWVVEWAFDCNWEDMNLRSKTDPTKYLDLRWGGFPCCTVFPYDSDIAKANRDQYEAQVALDAAHKNYKKQEEIVKAQEALLRVKRG